MGSTHSKDELVLMIYKTVQHRQSEERKKTQKLKLSTQKSVAKISSQEYLNVNKLKFDDKFKGRNQILFDSDIVMNKKQEILKIDVTNKSPRTEFASCFTKRKVASNPVSIASTPMFKGSIKNNCNFDRFSTATPLSKRSKKLGFDEFCQTSGTTNVAVTQKISNTPKIPNACFSIKNIYSNDLPFETANSKSKLVCHKRINSTGLPVRLFDTGMKSQKNINATSENDMLNIIESLDLRKISLRRRRSFQINTKRE